MIYIHGINHSIQHFRIDKSDLQKDFEHSLKSFVLKNKIKVCAEEMSKEALNNDKSILCDFSHRQKLTHIFCDPDSKERAVLMIPSQDEIKKQLGYSGLTIEGSAQDNAINAEQSKYWSMRECFWFEKIKNLVHKENILFLCGLDHVVSFSTYLRGKNIDVNTVVVLS